MEFLFLLLLAALGIFGSRSYSNSRSSYNYRKKRNQSINWTYDFKTSLDDDAEWKELRKTILKRDGYKCVECDFTKNLTVHHITPKNIGGEDDAENLVTLCLWCHEKKHGRKIFDEDEEFKTKKAPNSGGSEKLRKINSALRSGGSIDIKYLDQAGNTTHREVKPIRIFEEYGLLYLRAYCKLRNEERTFRISRISL
jgi:hypothetical protein